MRTHYTVVLLSLIVGPAAAQPTLIAGQASASPGESYLVQTGPHMDSGFGWFGGTADFSTFTPTGTSTRQYVTPASTTYGSTFPTATVAELSSPGAWGYLKTGPSAYEMLGVKSASSSLVCNSGITIIPYPITYGDQVSDSYSCSGTSAGETFTRTGEAYIDADGYGTLLLPYGSLSNVLRIYHQNEYTDVGPLIDDQGWVYTYYWFKPGIEYPVLAIYEVTTFFTSVQYTWMLDPSSTGVQEALRNSIGMELYPNPATASVSVVFGAEGRLRYELIDATGRVAIAADLGVRAAGIHREEIDLGGLAPGLYNVRITDEHSGSGTQRLVVQ